MPELPEVETIVRELARVVPGHRIREVEVLRPDLIEKKKVEYDAKYLEEYGGGEE